MDTIQGKTPPLLFSVVVPFFITRYHLRNLHTGYILTIAACGHYAKKLEAIWIASGCWCYDRLSLVIWGRVMAFTSRYQIYPLNTHYKLMFNHLEVTSGTGFFILYVTIAGTMLLKNNILENVYRVSWTVCGGFCVRAIKIVARATLFADICEHTWSEIVRVSRQYQSIQFIILSKRVYLLSCLLCIG